MIAFIQLPIRSSVLTAHAMGETAELQVAPHAPAGQAKHRHHAVLAYLRLIEFRTRKELGPRVVGITLSLILAAQLALVLWLYLNEGRL